MNELKINNETIKQHRFLEEMVNDAYFPPHLVAKGQSILLRMCETIEAKQPKDLAALYVITHAATDEFNDLAEAFYEEDSEIETAAREAIGADFLFIAQTYGFDADNEELIATRDW